MGYKKIAPSIALQPFVNHFWILDVQEEDLPFVHTILPFAWFELFFELHESSSREAKYIGQLSHGFKITHDQPYRVVGVCLMPHVADALFPMPAHVLSDASIDFSDLDPDASIHDQLLAAESERETIQLLEHYITEKFKQYCIDDVSAYISQCVLRQPHLGLHDAMFTSIGLGRRRIEQRFLRSTGVSMGQFARRARFDRAVDMLCQDDSISLTHAGLDLGYYDQAHFSREFKSFAGMTPKAYRKELQQMTEIERALQ